EQEEPEGAQLAREAEGDPLEADGDQGGEHGPDHGNAAEDEAELAAGPSPGVEGRDDEMGSATGIEAGRRRAKGVSRSATEDEHWRGGLELNREGSLEPFGALSSRRDLIKSTPIGTCQGAREGSLCGPDPRLSAGVERDICG